MKTTPPPPRKEQDARDALAALDGIYKRSTRFVRTTLLRIVGGLPCAEEELSAVRFEAGILRRAADLMDAATTVGVRTGSETP